jgi:hypothetical protein
MPGEGSTTVMWQQCSAKGKANLPAPPPMSSSA